MRYEVTKEDKKAEHEEKPRRDVKTNGIMATDDKAEQKQAEKEEQPERRKFAKTKKEMAKKKAKGLKKFANKNDYKED